MGTELTPTQIASTNSAYWAILKRIRLQAGRFSFDDREYQKEPMSSEVRRTCYMKATQGGFTEIEILKALHGMINRLYLKGVLYMFPTTDDVREFGKSRFNPLISVNREAIGKYVKSTDTASLKKIHDAFLFLRGARLSQKRSDDAMESSKMRGISVDRAIFDEMDLMDIEVCAKAIGRMGDSDRQEECYISNPGVPEEGIDAVFLTSDQRHWFRKCLHCGEWTCAELSFPDCVKVRNDGTGYIGCDKCGKEVFIRDGEWVPAERDNSDYMHGYNWSQLTSVKNDPAEILQQYLDPPFGNLGDVIKLRLGQAYIAEEDRLTVAQVLGCCGSNPPVPSSIGPCAMGVDVGKVKHIIIGIKTGRDRYEILKTTQLSEWDDIHDLARRFNVKSAVIDLRPYEDRVRMFQKAESYRIFLCDYKENMPQDTNYNDKTGIVFVNRTEIFDATHRLVSTEGKLTIPRLCPEVREFAKQVCAAYKILETNKRTNQSVYRYKGTKEHYRNALNYFLLAASKSRLAMAGSNKSRQKLVISNYARI